MKISAVLYAIGFAIVLGFTMAAFLYWLKAPDLTQMQIFIEYWQAYAVGVLLIC